LHKHSFRDCIQTLLKLFFFSESSNRFFSYTISENEISVIGDSTALSQFPEGSIVIFGDRLKIVKCDFGALGFSENSNIVNSISEVLARVNISILFLSTFNTDFTFVLEKQVDTAMACLSSAFQINEEE